MLSRKGQSVAARDRGKVERRPAGYEIELNLPTAMFRQRRAYKIPNSCPRRRFDIHVRPVYPRNGRGSCVIRSSTGGRRCGNIIVRYMPNDLYAGLSSHYTTELNTDNVVFVAALASESS
ncbi:hypothetical protein EVAR_88959_1 [Eumeta japonica]|uniref:Uncharacterized protein n=1 Tax=Eumeta variegata TaxID=151549 RepID=A0A4C1VP63_EUMVA|nr:hypothetical protein EVAR_88959_1 [Eumeta japonica]